MTFAQFLILAYAFTTFGFFIGALIRCGRDGPIR